MSSAPRMSVGVLLVVLCLVGFGVARANAAPILTFDESTGINASNNNQNVGWEFNVLSTITVTGLGWYDSGADGLSVEHTVGIWDPSGALISSAVLPSGTSLTFDGLFRTISVAPVVLSPGTGYIVGGQNFLGNGDRLASDVAMTVNPSIAFVDATFSALDVGFARPTQPSVAFTGFFGPSFSIGTAAPVPEPATLSLLGLGLVGAAVVRYRRRR